MMNTKIPCADPQTLTARVIVLGHILKRTTKAGVAVALYHRLQSQRLTVWPRWTIPKPSASTNN